MDISKLNAPYQITEIDPWLAPHAGDIELRMNRFKEKRYQLVGEAGTLTDFANGHLYFGFHRTADGWVRGRGSPVRRIQRVGQGKPSAGTR